MTENSMTLNSTRTQLFPIVNRQKTMVDGPNNLVKIHINNFQINHQHQIIPIPMLDKIFYRTQGSTVQNSTRSIYLTI